MMDIFKQLEEIFMGFKTNDKADETDDKTDEADDDTDSEQPDTTDTPDLESEESAEQRRNQKRQGLKILTPDQMLGRLPISSAQLKAENDLEKLKTK